MTETNASRRNVILGVAAVGAAVPVIAACGSSSGSANDKTGVTSSEGDGAASGIRTTDIPVGGGTVFADRQIVVTQPTAGDFKAFSAVCTHQGCTVNKVADKQIQCPCHFSHFSIEDGSVESGPAPKPLPAKKVTVTGDTITVS